MGLGNSRNYIPSEKRGIKKSMPWTHYNELTVGYDDHGHDVKFFGATSGSYLLWDESADKLILEGSDFLFGDSDYLIFGDGSDATINWDGTNLIITATADDTLIEIGDAAVTQKSFDLKWYANEANGASYLLCDASANAISTVGVSLTLGSTLTVGVNDTGYDVTFYGATSGVKLLWDESVDQLIVTGNATSPALQIAGAGSKSAAAYAAVGAAWADAGTPAFIADQMYARISVGGTVYRLPLWADA